MTKKRDSDPQSAFASSSYFAALNQPQDWQEHIAAVALRFNREYQGKLPELPTEVQDLPIYQEWKAGLLQDKLTSPFWELAKPQKNQRCLDIGCGVSFLLYSWREWDAFFYGQEISTAARDILQARGPQLNSKLFKGVKLAPAHQLDYEAHQFDLVIATCVSCYYPIAYWMEVMTAVKRVLKPGGYFVFDVLNPEAPLAENWAILETYLGAEVSLAAIADWETAIKTATGRSVKKQNGELFSLYKVSF